MTDTELLDYLESLKVGYGKGWVLRPSTTGRGMRLHETGREDAVSTARQAIEKHYRLKQGVPF